MHCHKQERIATGIKRVVLVGNPNVGKSVIFGLLTGRYVTVSNYPGTTVEVSQGNMKLSQERFLVIDTPGVNSLIPMSEDERVTRDILLSERPYAVIQVADSKNLKRTLMLLTQLAEMQIPVVLDLNMEDEARDKGIEIDKAGLSEMLGIDVVGTVAPRRKGLRKLRDALKEPKVPKLLVRYPEPLEGYIKRIEEILPEAPVSKRSLAVMVLAGDESLKGWLNRNLSKQKVEELEVLVEECQRLFPLPLSVIINNARVEVVEGIVREVLRRTEVKGGTIRQTLEAMSMHPLGGIPVLLVVLYGLYQFVGVFGAGTLVDLLEGVVFERYINPMTIKTVELLFPSGFIHDLFVGQYGIVTMALTYAIAIILPITTTFFIAFSLLEDSGYLPRLAILSNRAFNLIGLNGKAILPMVLGLGCGTMAVMTTRILETRRDRIIATFLLALAIPCSAQLGVILGMVGSLSGKATLIWFGTVIGVLMVSGYLASRVVPGSRSELFLEIPPLRVPRTGNVLLKTLGRIEWYLKEAVPLFILGTLVLFLLDKMMLLGLIEKTMYPIVHGVLGLPQETAGFFLMGFLRRDYGAAGLFSMAEKGLLTPQQTLVSIITITLFVPCLANFFMIIKERGLKVALIVTAVVFFIAFFVGGMMNFIISNVPVLSNL